MVGPFQRDWTFCLDRNSEENLKKGEIDMTMVEFIGVLGFTITVFSLGYMVGKNKNDRS